MMGCWEYHFLLVELKYGLLLLSQAVLPLLLRQFVHSLYVHKHTGHAYCIPPDCDDTGYERYEPACCENGSNPFIGYGYSTCDGALTGSYSGSLSIGLNGHTSCSLPVSAWGMVVHLSL